MNKGENDLLVEAALAAWRYLDDAEGPQSSPLVRQLRAALAAHGVDVHSQWEVGQAHEADAPPPPSR